jgi:hypothetical protein
MNVTGIAAMFFGFLGFAEGLVCRKVWRQTS